MLHSVRPTSLTCGAQSFGKAFGHDIGPRLTNHSIVRIAAPPAHFTGAHASRLTVRTKLWRLFQAIRVLVERAGPMVRIRLPPAASQAKSIPERVAREV